MKLFRGEFKSISWKGAFVFVICMHLFVYLGISQYSSYRVRKAKELKEARNSLYTEKQRSEWPQNNSKKRIVAVPKPLIPLKKEEASTKKNNIINFNFPQISINFNQPSKPTSPQPLKSPKIKKEQVIVPKSTPSPTEVSKPFNDSRDIPIKRATIVRKGNIQESIEETRRVLESRVVLW